ncbi:MAG TPA: Ig-like domain-containing protein [Candidatus Thermoplasmatota archaeon]|nr:Ig-like domain-containing protein [Candidatus Thermoplasmatota archaeon]
MNKYPLIKVSSCAVVLLVLGSLSSAVGYRSVKSSALDDSLLFNGRMQRAVKLQQFEQSNFFNDERLDTRAIYYEPYEFYNESLNISVLGADGANNITLYYRYSANNLSHWDPGGDYLDTALSDAKTIQDDGQLDYPQRLWFDEKNQRMFIAGLYSNTLMIWNVSKQWNLVKETYLTDSQYLWNVHDVKVLDNWSYGGINYGNIALVGGGAGPFYLSTIRCNLSETPVRLDSYSIGSGGTYFSYLDYFINSAGHLIVAATKMSNPGSVVILDASDPTNIISISQFTTKNPFPWNPFFFEDGTYLLIDPNTGTNNTPEIWDVSDLANPTFVEPLFNMGNHYSEVLHCFDTKNHTVYAARTYYDPANPNSEVCTLIAYDYSDPLNWVQIGSVTITSNGEWQLDFYTWDWAAIRHYKYGVTTHQVDFYNIKDPKNMYLSGIYQDPSLVEAPHMQWLDMPHDRGFFLDYTMNSFFALNLTVNLSHPSSWYEYETDNSPPWGWTFTFPNGTGYYQFCTRGWAGTDHEDFPKVADCGIHKNTGIKVVTGDASSVSPTEATLHGLLVHDGGGPCSVYFEYGTTMAYGNFTADQTKTAGDNFSETVTGLLPETLYHYRAVASNGQTMNNGTDRTFLTLPYIHVTIEKPQKAVYLLDQRLFSFPVPVIIGRIEVIANVTSGYSSIARVEFLIDGSLKATDVQAPYTWTWKSLSFSKHTLTATAYDTSGKYAQESMTVWKFL